MGAALIATGCRTISTESVFRDQFRRHAGDVTWVRGVEPLPGNELPPELRMVGGMVRFWRRGSATRLQWKLREAATLYGPVDATYRVARQADLWMARTSGSAERLVHMLEAGAPVTILGSRSVFGVGQPEPRLVVGFDRRDEAFLCVAADGNRQIVPRGLLEREWAAAGYRWILVLPANFNASLLTAAERFERGAFYEARGELEKALADYRAACEGETAAAAWLRQGNVLVRLNRPQEAEAAYREAMRWAPETPQAYNNLAMLLAETAGRAADAVKLARNALMLDPANPRILDTLGYSLYKSGATREAADVLERARGRARWLPPAAQAEIAVHLVRVHLANGDVHLAREVLRDALQWAPDVVPGDLRDLLK